MWIESISAGVVLIVVGAAVKFQNSRMKTMETDRKKELYQDNGQSIYVPRADCGSIQETFCKKIDKLTGMMVDMDEKRQSAKDDYHNLHREIAVQLASIEGKLPEKVKDES